MKTPAEVKFRINATEAISKLQRLGEAAQKAINAVDDFNTALEKCQKMDLEISIKYNSNTKKWYQFWRK